MFVTHIAQTCWARRTEQTSRNLPKMIVGKGASPPPPHARCTRAQENLNERAGKVGPILTIVPKDYEDFPATQDCQTVLPCNTNFQIDVDVDLHSG